MAVQQKINTRGMWGVWALVLGWSYAVEAAVLHLETYDSSAAGWVARDNDMTFSHMSGDGSSTGRGSGAGSIQGVFGASAQPLIDAFRAPTSASGGAFTGDYTALLMGDPLSWTFDFLAVHIAPSDLSLRFAGNGHFFFQPLSVPSVGTWTTYEIAVGFGSGWFGTGGATEFSLALASVDYVEVQFTMSGTDAQTYRMDDFELRQFENGPPGAAAIPEPGSTLLLMAAALLFVLRRMTPRTRRGASECERRP